MELSLFSIKYLALTTAILMSLTREAQVVRSVVTAVAMGARSLLS